MEEKKLPKRKKRWKIGAQMMVAYLFAVLVPVAILVAVTLYNTYANQKKQEEDLLKYNANLLKTYNSAVMQTLYEISTQIYTISDSIVYNDELLTFLREDYETEQELREAANQITLMDKYMENYAGIEEVYVYIDREDMVDFKQFRVPTEEIKETDWYKKAQEQYAPFWVCSWLPDGYGNYAWRLALVRKMILVGGEGEAVIMITIRDAYLSSRINNQEYVTMISVDDMPVFYSTYKEYCGEALKEPVMQGKSYDDSGVSAIDGENALYHLSSLDISKTSSDMYLLTYAKIQPEEEPVMWNYFLLLGAAILLPIVILWVFTQSVVAQVKGIRHEMGKASRGDYGAMRKEFAGSEELSEAFDELLVMVENIQRMEAEQYESKIREQKIEVEQQKMEFKMLASQINPHFLYNTLETIRMKAFTAGDKEVATAIKLLGKSMRYVLENTGTVETTFAEEMDHILTYLKIQQLRFGSRVNYKITIQPGLELSEYSILPLLLQPIVENAIVHGLEAREEDGCVWISIYQMDDGIHVDISDNGNGMDEETMKEVMRKVENYTRERRTSSIGLYNINRRIKLNYGEEYGISIQSTLGEGTMVTALLPVRKIFDVEKEG